MKQYSDIAFKKFKKPLGFPGASPKTLKSTYFAVSLTFSTRTICFKKEFVEFNNSVLGFLFPGLGYQCPLTGVVMLANL